MAPTSKIGWKFFSFSQIRFFSFFFFFFWLSFLFCIYSLVSYIFLLPHSFFILTLISFALFCFVLFYSFSFFRLCPIKECTKTNKILKKLNLDWCKNNRRSKNLLAELFFIFSPCLTIVGKCNYAWAYIDMYISQYTLL